MLSHPVGVFASINGPLDAKQLRGLNIMNNV